MKKQTIDTTPERALLQALGFMPKRKSRTERVLATFGSIVIVTLSVCATMITVLLTIAPAKAVL